MERKTFKRVVRDRHLTPDEVAADETVRRQVQKEFPPAEATDAATGDISSALRSAIKASSKSVYQICKEAGISPIIVSRFMSGERDIRLATADKLAKVLRIETVSR